MVYPNSSSVGDLKWGVILSNHSVCVLSNDSELCDLKMRLFAAPGQFSVRGSCKNAKDPLVPLLGAWSPCVVPAASPTHHAVGELGFVAPFLL